MVESLIERLVSPVVPLLVPVMRYLRHPPGGTALAPESGVVTKLPRSAPLVQSTRTCSLRSVRSLELTVVESVAEPLAAELPLCTVMVVTLVVPTTAPRGANTLSQMNTLAPAVSAIALVPG